MRVPLSRGGPIVNRADAEPSQDIAPHIDARSSHAMRRAMSDARLSHAIERIERALGRLEERGAPTRPAGDPGVLEALGQLQTRYDRLEERERRLRERTTSALDRLTALIERQRAG